MHIQRQDYFVIEKEFLRCDLPINIFLQNTIIKIYQIGFRATKNYLKYEKITIHDFLFLACNSH